MNHRPLPSVLGHQSLKVHNCISNWCSLPPFLFQELHPQPSLKLGANQKSKFTYHSTLLLGHCIQHKAPWYHKDPATSNAAVWSNSEELSLYLQLQSGFLWVVNIELNFNMCKTETSPLLLPNTHFFLSKVLSWKINTSPTLHFLENQ